MGQELGLWIYQKGHWLVVQWGQLAGWLVELWAGLLAEK